MKKAKLLYLLPFAALILGGCSFSDVKKAIGDSWIGEHILHPIYDPIKEAIKGKDEEKPADPGTTPEDPPVDPPVDPAGDGHGTLEAPLTVSQAKALIDGTETKPTEFDIYVTGVVKANTAWSEEHGNCDITIQDATGAELKIYRCGTLPEGFEKPGADALKYATVVAHGKGEIYKNTYELTSCAVDSVVPGEEPHGDPAKYGSLESPLSVTAAKALIDVEKPTQAVVFVTGTVKSNEAYNSTYNSLTVVLTDGENDIKLYQANVFPEGFPEAPGANELRYGTMVAHGTGKLFNTTYELDSGCSIDSYVPGEAPPVDPEKNYGSLEAPLTVSEAKALIDGEPDNITAQDIYVQGEVQSNEAWYAKNGNITLVLTDGQNTIKLFRAVTELEAVVGAAANALNGGTIIAHGQGIIYNETVYELNTGCVIDVYTPGETPTPVDPPIDPVDGTEISFVIDELKGASPISKEGITITNSSDYGTTEVTELRIYKGKVMTVSSSDKAILQIVITCTANGTTKQGPGCWGTGAPSGYTFEAEGKNGTWTGSAESVTFTAVDNQVRITAMKVIVAK